MELDINIIMEKYGDAISKLTSENVLLKCQIEILQEELKKISKTDKEE